MTLTKPEVKQTLAQTIGHPLRHQTDDSIYGVFRISHDGTSSSGKHFPPDAYDKAKEYYDKHHSDDTLYPYDIDTDFLVFYTATIAAVEAPSHPVPDPEIRMRLDEIEFIKYHTPNSP